MAPGKLVMAAAIGDCVHVAGALNFLRLAEEAGYRTAFLGPAVPPAELAAEVAKMRPDLVALSYRLSPEAGRRVMEKIKQELVRFDVLSGRFVFGGTPPVCRKAEKTGLFEACFDGTEGPEAVLAYLRGETARVGVVNYPQELESRIRWKKPYPLLRHHFGLPDLEETRRGIEVIAEAGVLDVISLGPDQNFQKAFFRPERMDPAQDGAGGVPIRTPGDLSRLFAASRRGNYPLMRCYSGTADVLRLAGILTSTIRNAWCAVPLFWYNVLDGRGPRNLDQSIREAQELLRWNASRGIPAEVNEAHHWGLRDAHDTIVVAAGFLAAYNAKKAGVRSYVAQYMFNTPNGASFKMDLAKMLAMRDLIESLQDDGFRVFREVRAGLTSFPVDSGAARGQLASSTFLQMALEPDIVHVVAYCEADHAATAPEVVESCRIVRGVIENCLFEGMPDMTGDPAVAARREELVSEARVLLDAILALAGPGVQEPWTDPDTLVQALRLGLLDAPHLKGNPVARGELRTRMIGGACRAVNDRGEPIREADRIEGLVSESRLQGSPAIRHGRGLAG